MTGRGGQPALPGCSGTSRNTLIHQPNPQVGVRGLHTPCNHTWALPPCRSPRRSPSPASSAPPRTRKPSREYEGLVAGPVGVGTFVTKTLADTSLPVHGPLRGDLEQWLGKARAAGLNEESIGLAPTATRLGPTPGHGRRVTRGGSEMTAVLESSGLAKRGTGAARPWRIAPSAFPPVSNRNGWPERRGDDHAVSFALGLILPTAGTITVLGERPASGPEKVARTAASA
jgi:hypothetical protein